MSIAAELINEWKERQAPKPAPPPEKRRPCCQGHDTRRKRCKRPPVVPEEGPRICAECWRGMMRRSR